MHPSPSPSSNESDDTILDTVCIDIGRFTIPKTVEDLRVLLTCIEATAGTETLSRLRREAFSFGGLYNQLEGEEKKLSCAPSEQRLEGVIRYAASAVIHAITEFEHSTKDIPKAVVTSVRQEWRETLYQWVKKWSLSAALQ